MIIAVPVFNGAVAPCFEAARTFILATVRERTIVGKEMAESGGCEGFGRVQLLRDRRVTTLVCNGIKAFYQDLLQAAGIEVIAGIAGPAGRALEDVCTGRIASKRGAGPSVDLSSDIPLEDLICWTKELFSAHGYDVRPGADAAPFPIDLVAEIRCPVCAKQVRVAICCGAHAYRPQQEIQSLHLAAAAGYHAKVYVHSGSAIIEQHCEQYGVELIDPDARYARRDHHEHGRIPILHRPIPGHEPASMAGCDEETT